MKKFVINDNDSGQRIDKFVTKALPDLPKSMMYRLIRKKDIKINGKRCDIASRLNTGDIVTIYVKDGKTFREVVSLSNKTRQELNEAVILTLKSRLIELEEEYDKC